MPEVLRMSEGRLLAKIAAIKTALLQAQAQTQAQTGVTADADPQDEQKAPAAGDNDNDNNGGNGNNNNNKEEEEEDDGDGGACHVRVGMKDAQKALREEAAGYAKNTEELGRLREAAAAAASARNRGQGSMEDLRKMRSEVNGLKSEISRLKRDTEAIRTKDIPNIQNTIKRNTETNEATQRMRESIDTYDTKIKAKKKALDTVNARLRELAERYEAARRQVAQGRELCAQAQAQAMTEAAAK